MSRCIRAAQARSGVARPLSKRPGPHSRQERGFTAARARGCAGAPVSRLHTRLSASRPHTRAVSGPAAPARGHTRRLVPACHSASHRPRAVTARGMRHGGTRGQRAQPELGEPPAAPEHRSTRHHIPLGGVFPACFCRERKGTSRRGAVPTARLTEAFPSPLKVTPRMPPAAQPLCRYGRASQAQALAQRHEAHAGQALGGPQRSPALPGPAQLFPGVTGPGLCLLRPASGCTGCSHRRTRVSYPQLCHPTHQSVPAGKLSLPAAARGAGCWAPRGWGAGSGVGPCSGQGVSTRQVSTGDESRIPWCSSSSPFPAGNPPA